MVLSIFCCWQREGTAESWLCYITELWLLKSAQPEISQCHSQTNLSPAPWFLQGIFFLTFSPTPFPCNPSPVEVTVLAPTRLVCQQLMLGVDWAWSVVLGNHATLGFSCCSHPELLDAAVLCLGEALASTCLKGLLYHAATVAGPVCMVLETPEPLFLL